MSDKRRCDEQPGLFMAAQKLCCTKLTDGFCTPKTRDNCQCWDKAWALMQASGLSAQAAAWIFSHLNLIEEQAAKWVTLAEEGK